MTRRDSREPFLSMLHSNLEDWKEYELWLDGKLDSLSDANAELNAVADDQRGREIADAHVRSVKVWEPWVCPTCGDTECPGCQPHPSQQLSCFI